jgi:hypothetical protein
MTVSHRPLRRQPAAPRRSTLLVPKARKRLAFARGARHVGGNPPAALQYARPSDHRHQHD